MQNIGVRRETENGRPLTLFDEGRSIDLRIVMEAPESSSCLRFIDPYGDLVINGLQLPVLISELREMSRQATDLEFKENIAKLVRFLEDEESQRPHIYIRFLGD